MSERDAPRAAETGDAARPRHGDTGASAAEPASAGSAVRPARGRGAVRLAALALVAALGAGAAAGLAGWQYRASQTELAATQRALEQLRAELERAEGRSADARERADAAAEARAALASRLDAVPDDIAALERRVDALAGGTGEARARWLRAEAEHYLEVANAELELADDWDGAYTALGLADTRLEALGNPRFAPVRALIAEERLALDGVERPDIEGFALRLAGLAERVADWPLRGPAAAREAPAERTREPPPAAEPGFGRLLAGLEHGLASLVRIERRDTPAAPALTTAERRLLRRELRVELGLARVALVRREPGLYASAIERAATLLEREFDTRAAAVAAAADELDALADVELAPPKPDIAGSLERLRALADDAQ